MRPLRCFSLVIGALFLLLTGCTLLAPPVPPQLDRTNTPADFPEAYYREALALRESVFQVDPAESQVVIEVHRSGILAHLGHDHVVASRDIRGYIAPEQGRADLYVALQGLTVDEPALRSEAGFDSQPSASDIEGTRANMVGKVLEVEKFPFALIRIRGADMRQVDAMLAVEITLHGVTRTLPVSVRIDADSDGINVSGELSFDQTDFGITPYSVLGGAIAVSNGLDLRFRIRARRPTDLTSLLRIESFPTSPVC